MANAISSKWRGLAGLGVLLGIALVVRPLHAAAADTLIEFHNTTLDHYLLGGTTANGATTYDLTLAASSKQLAPGARTATYGFNGSEFWGPTVIMNKGDLVRMRVQNNLTEATTTHWHGLLVSGAVDGGPHQIIAAGGTWLTDPFRVKNQAATYWYHPHLHEMTQKQLTLGAGGLIIVRDAAEAALDLPRAYGIDDIPLVLTSRRFTTTNGVANQLQYSAAASIAPTGVQARARVHESKRMAMPPYAASEAAAPHR